MFFGDFLDLHAAFGRGHQGDPAAGAVDQQAEIQLALDVGTFLDIQALDPPALGAGLLGDQHLTQHGGGIATDIVDGLDDPDPALAVGIVLEAASATAAGMDLRFDDEHRGTEPFGGGGGFVGGVGDLAARHGDAEFSQ